MTEDQLHQIDQARRYAEQDEYVVTRTHIRNLLAIIERQQAEAVANSATVCNMFDAFGAHYDDSLSPAENVRRLIQQQAASVPDDVFDAIKSASDLLERTAYRLAEGLAEHPPRNAHVVGDMLGMHDCVEATETRLKLKRLMKRITSAPEAPKP